MKVFISQPMNGQMEDVITLERENAVRWAKIYLNEPEILDSYFDYVEQEDENTGLHYLGKSISLLAQADIVLMCPGWKKARGCKIEYTCAVEYGIKVIEL